MLCSDGFRDSGLCFLHHKDGRAGNVSCFFSIPDDDFQEALQVPNDLGLRTSGSGICDPTVNYRGLRHA